MGYTRYARVSHSRLWCNYNIATVNCCSPAIQRQNHLTAGRVVRATFSLDVTFAAPIPPNLPLPAGELDPHNTWYLWSTRPTANGFSIESAVFAKYTFIVNGQTERQTDRQRTGYSACSIAASLTRLIIAYTHTVGLLLQDLMQQTEQ